MKCKCIVTEKKLLWHQSLFTADRFMKKCLQRIAEIMSPKQKQVFANVNLAGNIVQSVEDRLENFWDKILEKVKYIRVFYCR